MNTADFGARIREIRLRHGLSQAEFAKAAGVSNDTLSRLELGRHSPSLDTMVKLGNALGLTVIGLLKDDFDLSDELAELIRGLRPRDQEVAFAVVGALRVQLAVHG